MEQMQEQKKPFFEELKQIYNIKIPINKPKQNQSQKFLINFDLTNNNSYEDTLFKLSINNNEQTKWEGGFVSKLVVNKKNSIIFYYFNKLIGNDGKINILNLFRFRIFLQKFVSTQQRYQMKFVFHFDQKNLPNSVFEDHIIKCVYQILEGSIDKFYDIICVYKNQENQELNYCKISSQKIHFEKNQYCQQFDNSFIQKLDEFLDYFQFQQKDPQLIGYLCQNYLQEQVDVVLKEFEKELLLLQKDLLLMIEFPVNLNTEIESKENVKQYLVGLKSIILEIKKILNQFTKYSLYDEFNEFIEFDQMIFKLQQCLMKNRNNIIDKLSSSISDNSQFEIYMNIAYKDQQPQNVFNQLLQFKFELNDSDKKILKKLKKHNYNYDCLNQTLFRVILDTKQWFDYFDDYLPQSKAYLKRILTQDQNNNLDKPCVFLIGTTKVGKSTLMNILSNPQNIIVTKDKKFDVKDKDKKFSISHKNISETFQIEYVEIDNFKFFDCPGLCDTEKINRFINYFNLFNQITKAKQHIFLLMIDGEELLKKRNDLTESIDLIKLLLGGQNNDQSFENFIIPVFTKIQHDSTMKQIKEKWKNETMKDITYQMELKILKAIETAIIENKHIEIYNAETYLIPSQHQQLESEIKTMKEKVQILLLEDNFQEAKELSTQIQLKKQQQSKLQSEQQVQEVCLEKITKIKDDLIGKCKDISNAQLQFLNFEFKLSEELQIHLKYFLAHRSNMYQHILNIIINDFITKMLYDGSLTIKNKCEKIQRIFKMEFNQISDIPNEFINQDVQYQIEEFNNFNNIISAYEKKIEYKAVDFKQFKSQIEVLNELFSYFQNQSTLNQRQTLDVVTLMKKVSFMPFVFVLLPVANSIYQESLLVQEEEAKKKEKIILLQIQEGFYKQLYKKKQ